MKKMLLLIAMILLGITFVGSTVVFSQLKYWQKPSFKVKLKIGGYRKGEVASSLRRELRSLGDVVIADENPDYELNVFGMEMELRGDRSPRGVILSIVILRPFNKESCLRSLERLGKLSPDQVKIFRNYTDYLYFFYGDHWLSTCGPEELKGTCQRIVAKFDSQEFEPLRESHQKMIDQYGH